MRYVIIVSLLFAGVVHLLPLSGVLGAERLSSLYGIAVDDPNIVILMRHRAVLFGLLGTFLVVAAFVPAFQPAAFIAGLVSVTSFLTLAWLVGDYSPQISRIVVADVAALIFLLIGGGTYLLTSSRRVPRRHDRKLSGLPAQDVDLNITMR